MKSTNSAQLPDYITSARPSSPEKRAPWYTNTAPTYAGIFLWFVFWQDAAKAGSLGGTLSQGIGVALVSVVAAALICHFLFYLIPALLGMRTGLPLYIVGTSTFGATGGFLMPGFLMGVLQFGWLAVNIYFSSIALANLIPVDPRILMVLWGALAAFIGLKGIQYVAKVATYLPIIPLVILLAMFVKTMSGLGDFKAENLIAMQRVMEPSAPAALGVFGVLAMVLTYIVGFFATAGAAGADFGTGSRNVRDVQLGGLTGVALAIVLTAGLSILVVAGFYGTASKVLAGVPSMAGSGFVLDSFNLIPLLFGKEAAKWLMFGLAVAAFPTACFSSLIAANSFRTTLPKVEPFLSVGIGAAVSIALALTGWAGKVVTVFVIIGASFGPICGAMAADYLLSGRKWAGPRKGFNPAGWAAWAAGFVVGILPNLGVPVPAAPLWSFVAGFVVYAAAVKMGLQSETLPLPASLAGTTK